MRFLGRLAAIIILILIVPATACAFWLYNANRIALEPRTYERLLDLPLVYNELLPELLTGFAKPGETPRQAEAVLRNIPRAEWTFFSQSILPNAEAQVAVANVVKSFFVWLDYGTQTLEATLDMTKIRERLQSAEVQQAVTTMVSRIRPCTAEQTQQLRDFTVTSSFQQFPVCQPSDEALRKKEIEGLVVAFELIGTKLPDQWSLSQEFRLQIEREGSITPPNADIQREPPPEVKAALGMGLNQFRGWTTLQSRLLSLLFLIPIALLFMIVIVTIRSVKSFFRWIGWALVVSGIISLLPVFALPGVNSSFSEIRVELATQLGTGGGALGVLFSAMLEEIVNRLTLSVLFQVAGLIVVGLVLVFISVIIPTNPDQDDEDDEQALSQIEKKLLAT
jgi:hypothetical protein